MVYMDVGPPVRLMAFVTMICCTLDVLADIVLSVKLMTKVPLFATQAAVNASYAYVFFTGISIIVYFLEMADVIYTLRNGKENMQYARIAKSCVIALEEVTFLQLWLKVLWEIMTFVLKQNRKTEALLITPYQKIEKPSQCQKACPQVPLPVCLYVLLLYEPIMSVARPAVLVASIKLIALVWGITKFTKLRFCWFFLPLTQSHGFHENVRRCFTPTPYRIVMLIVNICHITAIIVVIMILILALNAQPAVVEHITDYDDY